MLFQDEGLFAIDYLLFRLLFSARVEKRRADVEWTKKTQLELLERRSEQICAKIKSSFEESLLVRTLL